ncbi:MAG: proprotein convertase P-domain-containing protein [Phaeodactylibacter sp.]|nr:proprotein convertase P-domain-containing protein [Phaeodactylibacter sp.]
MSISTRIVAPIVAAIILFAAGPAVSQTYIMGSQASANTCSGLFVDSGGNNAGYSANENSTITICPGNSGDYIQLSFSGVDIDSLDSFCFYDGSDASGDPMVCYANNFYPARTFLVQATAANPSGCLTITFQSDGSGQGDGWNADIRCITACQNIFVGLADSDPAPMPTDTGWIDICPGERVSFNGQGFYPQNGVNYQHSDFTSEFTWDFGDGTMAVGPEVSHVYDEPGGYIVQLFIRDQRGCTSLNYLNQRVRVATYPDFSAGGNLPDEICVGDTIALNASLDTLDPGSAISVMTTEGSFQTAGVLSDSLPLPDGTGTSYETSISFSDFSPGQTLTNINQLLGICVSMEHSWMYDLDVELQCPDGTRIVLQDQDFITNEVHLGEPFEADDSNTPFPPGQGVGYDYCWTPNSTNGTWTEYAQSNDPGGPFEYVLPSGDYESFQPLNRLVGCPLNGEWTIIVTDRWASDNGWIFEWSINFDPALYPALETYRPQILDFEWKNTPSIFEYSPDSLRIMASPRNAGTASFNFTVFDDYGCTHDTSVAITVLPYSHPDCYDCLENLAHLPDTTVCESEPVTLDVSTDTPTGSAITFEAIPQEPFGNGNYPPANPFESPITVNSISPGALTDPASQIASICLNIETNWNDDLDIYLESPSGELLELSTGNGGGSDNYTNTCFTPSATAPITGGTGPFTGAYQPEGDWSSLQGATINGEWKIVASDRIAPNDVGEFFSWSITFNSENEIQYTWTGAGLSCNDCPAPVATPSSTTTYTVSTLDSYGCSYSDMITVEIVDDIPAPVASCQQNEDGSLTFSWEPVGNFTQYEFNAILNGVASGWQGPVTQYTYTAGNLSFGDEVVLEVRVYTGNNQGCAVNVGSSSCISDACSLSTTLAGGPVGVSCYGSTDGSASLQSSGATAPIQYFLNGNPAPGTGAFTGLAAGDYTAVAVDATGCQDTVLFNISEPDSIRLAIQATRLIDCNGASTGELQATAQGGNGGFSFNWNTTPPISTATASDLPAGTFEVTVTDGAGCTAIAVETLTEPEALELEFNVTNATCAGISDGAIQAAASGGVGLLNYEWDNALGSVQNPSGLAAGAYSLTVTDANGCQITGSAEVAAPTAVVIDSIAILPVLCSGEETGRATVYASGGEGTYSYQWDDNLAQISQSATMLGADTYTVVVTDGNGCQVSAQATIPEPEPLSATFSNEDASCKGLADGTAAVAPTGGAAPYTFAWQDGQTTNPAQGLAAGTYGLAITDANGCILETSTTINEPAEEVTAVITQARRGCFGQSDNELTVAAGGGTGDGYTYLWSNGQSTATATGLDSVSYTVTVTDGNGCQATATAIAQDLEQLTFLVIPELPSCFGYSDGRLGVNEISGGAGSVIGDYSFTWSNGDTGPTADNLLGGVSYSVTATDSRGCTAMRTKLLPQPDEVTFGIATDSVRCFGNEDGSLSVENIQGEFPPYAYSWSDGQQTATAQGLAAGQYSVTVTDANGCFSSASATVAQPEQLEADFEKEDNPCFGDAKGSINVGVKGGVPGYSFLWSDGNTNTSLDNLPAGDYMLVITDQNGCQVEISTRIEEPEALRANLEKKDPTCFGFQDGSITINPAGGAPPYRYSLDGDFFSGSRTMIGLKAGDYRVRIRDANGCSYSSPIELADPPLFTVTPGADSYTINLGDTLALSGSSQNAAGTPEFVWSAPYEGTLECTECKATRAFPETSILYELYGIDEKGCEYTHKFYVYVEKNRIVAVPTGFTPNDDNTNDLLRVHGREGTTVKRFQVFDRWGELLYQAADFPINSETTGWDGTFRGQPVNGGVYIWYVVVEYEDGMEESFQGHTTLIR